MTHMAKVQHFLERVCPLESFGFPDSFVLFLRVPVFSLLLPQGAESTSPTLRAGEQSGIMLAVSSLLQAGAGKGIALSHSLTRQMAHHSNPPLSLLSEEKEGSRAAGRGRPGC